MLKHPDASPFPRVAILADRETNGFCAICRHCLIEHEELLVVQIPDLKVTHDKSSGKVFGDNLKYCLRLH